MSGTSHADIPIFPLNTVLFPGGVLPLRIFEQRYMEMSKACIKEDAPFGVCLIKSGKEVGAPAAPEEVGCLARIAEWDMQQLGLLTVKAAGEKRFRILERWNTDAGLLRAHVEVIAPDEDSPLASKFQACAQLLRAAVGQNDRGIVEEPHCFDSTSWVSCRLAEILPLPLAFKQELLELSDSRLRIEIINNILDQSRLIKEPEGPS